ncbi:class I SAM-dependent methyltransferase [Geminocystis sp. CENA526]|uniref:class I SAM-dependent methyltransferase n=1 Tax=Geminocystis sp. CENA526 TaxID=1355871 RepID=UPI003D6E0333
MIEKIFILLIGISPNIKKTLWRFWYQFLANSYQKTDWQFMNYGFYDLNSELSSLNLAPEDENNYYSINLYHYVASVTQIKNKQVLEVGCGRGGGSAYVAKYLQPQKIIGIDFSEQNIKLAQKFYHLSNLSFVQGDAENLPFENDTFDVILNVESSHCYGSMSKFLAEVYRVLKPSGIFSWADLRPINEVENLKENFAQSGLKQIKTAIITPNVLKSLELVDKSKKNVIKNYVPTFFQGVFQEFAGVKNSQIYNAFETGEMVYLSYVFQK